MKNLTLHQLINSTVVSPADLHKTLDTLSQSIIEANNLRGQFSSEEDMLGSIMLFISENYKFEIIKAKMATHILCNPK